MAANTIGKLIDRLYVLRTRRLEASRKVDEMKERELALQEEIQASLKKSKLEGAKGVLASVSISRSTVAAVGDWGEFHAYIAREGAFDLLQRRVNDAAFRARLEDGVAVPGVSPVEVLKLSVNKVGG